MTRPHPERGTRRPERTLRAGIYSLAFGGEGVGKVEGKICFVKGALPGEEVMFDVVKEAAAYVKGELKEVLKPSPDRTEPACKYYGKCGGCQLQHISYEKELFYKREQLNELIGRIAGKKDVKCLEIMPSPGPYHYRSNVTLHRKDGGWGYYAADGVTVLTIDECPIAEEALSAEFGKLPAEDGKDSLTLKADVNGKVWVSDRPGERFFPDRYGDTEIFVSPKVFTQANRAIALEIAATLTEWIGGAHEDTAFFDAYCGIGFFTFLIKNEFGLRVGMDSNRLAIDCAQSTERKNGIKNVKFYLGEAEKEFGAVFERLKKRTNVLFLDPPRQGVEKAFLEEIREIKEFDRIYYLSCDPARLARDIKVITDKSGWELGRVKPFDMFPRTKHIEALAEFVRK